MLEINSRKATYACSFLAFYSPKLKVNFNSMLVLFIGHLRLLLLASLWNKGVTLYKIS